MRPDFHFMATGIGSVPSTDVKPTCRNILNHLPKIPFWPQFVKRSHLEEMNIQFSEGLPLLEIKDKGRSLTVSPDGMEQALVAFYDHFLAEDIDYFAISEERAPGLFELVRLIQQSPEEYGPYIKGQSVGPLTFAASIKEEDGKSILYHADLLEAFTKGLAIKALWQVRELGKSGKRPILFLDEPYLSGFGSAFSPIDRDEVINLIKEIIEYLRDRSDVLIGIHCCGNTDWSMIIETKPDIVNFDACGYLDYFLLYPQEIKDFITDGGTIAWGIVPTMDFTEEESTDGLYLKLEEGIHRLHEWGLDLNSIAESSMLTPSCGMGTMDQASSDSALRLLSMLSQKCGDAYSRNKQ